jgi:hypothetical protein
MNIYEMYIDNGNGAGFWVKRNSWGNTCALVNMVGGRGSGALPGDAPYFLNVAVHADVFELATGRPKECNILLSGPGTFAYERIEAPQWSRSNASGHAELLADTGRVEAARVNIGRRSEMAIARYVVDARTKAASRYERRDDGIRVERAFDSNGALVAEDVATIRVEHEQSPTQVLAMAIDAPHEDFWFAKEAIKAAGGKFNARRDSKWRLPLKRGREVIDELRREGFVIEDLTPSEDGPPRE